jgi:pimeloyl-ACP methyl ester carboxylesterase/DNA-binding CsgD family transcriptional regulator
MRSSNRLSGEAALTEREGEILNLLCEGRSNHEIADQLHLAYGTVKWYASQIYRKLDVTNRVQAIAKAHKLNLIQPPAAPAPSEKILQLMPQPAKIEQTIHILTSFDDAKIAYAISGEGPPFIEAAHFMSHLEYEWDSPIYRHLLAEFMRGHTLIRYDERGTGMSEWGLDDYSFEAWVRDLEALVETTHAERFPLFGKSQAAAVAVAYAARHPDKVSHLILLGSYARGHLHRDLTPEQREEIQTRLSMVKVGWDQINPAYRHAFATNEFPNGPIELVQEMEQLIQVSSNAENIIRVGEAMISMDVRELAPQVKAPTLIFHAIHDQVVPFEEGRLLASLIPDAQFVALDTMNHLLVEGEPAWLKFQETLRRFLET